LSGYPTFGLNVESFSSARFLVSALIHSSPSIVSFIARRRFFTISCMRAFASGGKYFSTYFCPSASPSSWSAVSEQRFQRGFISFCPAR
jgi:hypothetical protein